MKKIISKLNGDLNPIIQSTNLDVTIMWAVFKVLGKQHANQLSDLNVSCLGKNLDPGPGFEPGLKESESLVLPLNYPGSGFSA